MDRQYSTDSIADTAHQTANNAAGNASAVDALHHKDRRFLRKTELVRAFGKAVRNDLLLHPWKLFFLAAPIAPPLSGMITVLLTALHFQLGLTQHARTQKAIIKDGFSRPIDGGLYAPFVKAAQCASCQPDAPREMPSPQAATLDRWAIVKHMYYQGMSELYGMSIQYGQSLRNVFGVKAGLRYIERRQTSVQGKMTLNLEKSARADPCCPTPQR